MKKNNQLIHEIITEIDSELPSKDVKEIVSKINEINPHIEPEEVFKENLRKKIETLASMKSKEKHRKRFALNELFYSLAFVFVFVLFFSYFQFFAIDTPSDSAFNNSDIQQPMEMMRTLPVNSNSKSSIQTYGLPISEDENNFENIKQNFINYCNSEAGEYNEKEQSCNFGTYSCYIEEFIDESCGQQLNNK